MSQQGIPLGRHLRPRAAWYGKMKLVPHIGRIARTGAVDVVVTWGEPVAYDGATDRKELARDAGSRDPRARPSRRCAERRRGRAPAASRGRFIWRQKALRQGRSAALRS